MVVSTTEIGSFQLEIQDHSTVVEELAMAVKEIGTFFYLRFVVFESFREFVKVVAVLVIVVADIVVAMVEMILMAVEVHVHIGLLVSSYYTA